MPTTDSPWCRGNRGRLAPAKGPGDGRVLLGRGGEMAISGDDFLKLDDADLIKASHVPSCAKCERRLQETITGYRNTAKGPMCSDCYFEELGAFVAAHPIALPLGQSPSE